MNLNILTHFALLYAYFLGNGEVLSVIEPDSLEASVGIPASFRAVEIGRASDNRVSVLIVC